MSELFPRSPAGPSPQRSAPFQAGGPCRASVGMHDIVLPIGHHALDVELVESYRIALLAGGSVMPVELDRHCYCDEWGGERSLYVLTDGRHRYAAHLLAGFGELPALVTEGF